MNFNELLAALSSIHEISLRLPDGSKSCMIRIKIPNADTFETALTPFDNEDWFNSYGDKDDEIDYENLLQRGEFICLLSVLEFWVDHPNYGEAISPIGDVARAMRVLRSVRSLLYRCRYLGHSQIEHAVRQLELWFLFGDTGAVL